MVNGWTWIRPFSSLAHLDIGYSLDVFHLFSAASAERPPGSAAVPAAPVVQPRRGSAPGGCRALNFILQNPGSTRAGVPGRT